MTGFKLFQKPVLFEPFECLECNQMLSTAEITANHLSGHFPDLDEPEDYLFHVDDAEEMNEDEKIDLEKWIQPNSLLTNVYNEWIAWFGYIECAYCTEQFRSKIAWFYHVVNVHQIHPDRLYEKSSLQLKTDQNGDLGYNQDNYDDIPVSTKYEVDFDPPSPKIPPKNRKRARVSELNSNDSGNGSLEENSVLPSLLEDVYEELIEDECFEVWLDFAVVPALIEDFRPYVQKQKQLRAKLQTKK